jgi:hypothetical protein
MRSSASDAETKSSAYRSPSGLDVFSANKLNWSDSGVFRGCGSTILVMKAQREVKCQADPARHNQPNRKGAYAIARRISASGKAVAMKIASMLSGCMVTKPNDRSSVPIPRRSRRPSWPSIAPPGFSRCCSLRHRSASARLSIRLVPPGSRRPRVVLPFGDVKGFLRLRDLRCFPLSRLGPG